MSINQLEMLVSQPTNKMVISEFRKLAGLSDKYETETKVIKSSIKSITANFILIAGTLYNVKLDELYIAAEYKNIYDYAYNEFELTKTTVKNLINIADRFLLKDKDGYSEKQMKQKYQDYGFTQLVELLPLSEDEMKNYSPSLTTREIRENKAKQKMYEFFDNYVNGDDSFIKECIDYVEENHYPLKAEIKKEKKMWNDQEYYKVIFKDDKTDYFKFLIEIETYSDNDIKIYFYSTNNDIYMHGLELYAPIDNLKKLLNKYFKDKKDLDKRKQEQKEEKQKQKQEYKNMTNFERFIKKNYWKESCKCLEKLNKENPGIFDNYNIDFRSDQWSDEITLINKQKDIKIYLKPNEIEKYVEGDLVFEKTLFDFIKDELINFAKTGEDDEN